MNLSEAGPPHLFVFNIHYSKVYTFSNACNIVSFQSSAYDDVIEESWKLEFIWKGSCYYEREENTQQVVHRVGGTGI